jgi:hypothetical protein
MVGRLDEQMRRGHADLPVMVKVGKGRNQLREIQDVRVIFEDGVPVRIEMFDDLDWNHIT